MNRRNDVSVLDLNCFKTDFSATWSFKKTILAFGIWTSLSAGTGASRPELVLLKIELDREKNHPFAWSF